jgi:hypothetical protein
MVKFKQGYYEPKNPEKCILTKESLDSKGNMFRSSWELRAMRFFDLHPGILKWSSEPFGLEYFNPVKGKVSKYFIDFYCETQTGEKFLVEVKPFKETIKPKIPKNQTPKSLEVYQSAIATFAVNTAKWDAAKKFCENKGIKFLILTEKEIFI